MVGEVVLGRPARLLPQLPGVLLERLDAAADLLDLLDGRRSPNPRRCSEMSTPHGSGRSPSDEAMDAAIDDEHEPHATLDAFHGVVLSDQRGGGPLCWSRDP